VDLAEGILDIFSDSMHTKVLVHRIQNAFSGRLDGAVQCAAAGVFMSAAAKPFGHMGDANRALAT
jgi:hypothetical protein